MKTPMTPHMHALLYYTSEQVGKHYVAQVTKNPEVPRLLAGKQDWWIDPAPTPSYRPKTIILHDWTFQGATLQTKRQKKACLECLLSGEMGDAFDIWVHTGLKLEPLTERNKHRLDDMLPQKSIHKDVLLAAIKEKNLSEESCLLLDHVAFSGLLTGVHHEPYLPIEGIATAERYSIEELERKTGDALSDMQAYYPDTRICITNHSIRGGRHLSLWEAIQTSYPDQTEEDIDSLEIMEADQSTVIETLLPSAEDLQHIKHIHASNLYGKHEHNATITRVVNIADQCEGLRLSVFSSSLSQLTFHRSKTLKSLEMTVLGSTRRQVSACPVWVPRQLTTLFISSLPEIDLSRLLEEGGLPQLKRLGLTCPKLAPDQLRIILATSPLLDTLTIMAPNENFFDIALAEDPHIETPLKYLRHLTLSANRLDTLRVTLQLDRFTHSLETLEFRQCFTTPPKEEMRRLTSLTLSYVSVDAAELHMLLSHCPNLVTLTFDRCTIAGEFDELNLPLLEYLMVTKTTLNGRSIAVLLNATTQLRTCNLDLTLTDSASGQIELKPLRQLEKLDLVLSDNGPESTWAVSLLGNTPSLKEFKSYSLDKLPLEDLPPNSLKQLEKLHLSGKCSLSLPHLIRYSSHSLREIDLFGEMRLGGTIPGFIKSTAFTALERVRLVSYKYLDEELWSGLFAPMIDSSPCFDTFSLICSYATARSLTPSAHSKPHSAVVECDPSNPDLRCSEQIARHIRESIEQKEIVRNRRQATEKQQVMPLRGALSRPPTNRHRGGGGGGSKGLVDDAPDYKEERSTTCVRNNSLEYEWTGDANTKNALSAFPPQQSRKIYAFNGQHPGAREYRQDFYDTLEVNPSRCSIDRVFKLRHTPPTELEQARVPKTSKDLRQMGALLQAGSTNKCFFYTKEQITLTERWTVLLSLSPEDDINFLSVQPSITHEIAYNKRDRCYMIRTTSRHQQTVIVEYISSHPVESQKPAPRTTKEEQDLRDIKALIADLSSYGEGGLDLSGCKTGADYLTAMMQQRKGACRHRSFVLKHLMNTSHSQYPTRVIRNDIHAFVEISIGGTVLRCDLGGYPIPHLEQQDAVPIEDFEPFVQNGKRSDFDTPLVPPGGAAAAGEAAEPDIEVEPAAKPAPDPEAIAEVEPAAEVAAEVAAEAAAKPAPDPEAIAEVEPAAEVAAKPVAEAELEVEPENELVEISLQVPISEEKKRALLQEICAPSFAPKLSQHLSQAEKINRLLREPGQKHLLLSDGNDAHQASLLEIYQNAKDSGYPVFLVRSPDDLTLHLGLIKQADNTGVRTQEASGPLHDFLNALPENGPTPILLIDFSHFTQHDVIRSNSLADETRRLEKIELPPRLTLIGCQDTSLDSCYTGSDLYRRYTCNDNHNIKRSADSNLFAQQEGDAGITINLYHNATEAESWLRGRWTLDRSLIRYRDGQLIQALKAAREAGAEQPMIKIINAPLDPAYRLFWEKVAIDGEIDGVPIDVNRISHNPEMQYEQVDVLETEEMAFADAEPNRHDLNPESLPDFFVHYTEEGHELLDEPGLLQQAQAAGHHSLSVLVTHSLKRSQWAELLDEALVHGVTLDVRTLPGVPAILPEDRAVLAPVEHEEIAFDLATPNPFITSTCIDETVRQLKEWKQKERAAIVIQQAMRRKKGLVQEGLLHSFGTCQVLDVSELEGTDLFLKMDAEVDAHNIVFTQKKQAILRLLEGTNKTIILTGHFSDALVGTLLPYIRRYPNRLFCVTDSPKVFGRFGCQTHAVPTPAVDVRAFIHLDDRAMVSVRPFSGAEEAAAASEAFFEQRKQVIGEALAGHPYVFISGLTGVGKSTFIQKYYPHALWGDDKLSEWADNPAGGVLFLDEANINSRQWTEFEGLFNDPQSLLIDGEIKYLTADHKVIFAGNPLKAGGARQLARLFKHHGHAVVFQPLTADVIYHDILRPIASGTLLQDRLHELAPPLLEAYNEMVSLSRDKILVTPRQLKLIMMMTLSACEEDPDLDPAAVLNDKARVVLLPLLDKRNHWCLNESFPARPLAAAAAAEPIERLGEGFWVTESRRPALNCLNDLLRIRRYQAYHHDVDLNADQARGGICSLVLEGMPGTGKTQLAQALMQEQGFREAQYDAEGVLLPDQPFNTYHMIPPTLSLAEKISRLIQAFKAGHVVIMDEVNASPMMEDLINELLMGTYQGKHAPQPGFVLLGTQNPFSMGYRQKESTAQEKRMIKVKVPEYPMDEMIAIADKLYGISRLHAEVLAALFEKAKKEDPKRPLTFSCFLTILAEYAPRADDVERMLQQTETIKQTVDARALTRRKKQLEDMAAKKIQTFFRSSMRVRAIEAEKIAKEQQRLAEEERRRQAEAAAEQQRLAEEERRREAEAAAEQQRLAEEEKRRQAEAAAEQQRLAEEEKRRQAEAAAEQQRLAEEEKRRQAEAAAEQQRLAEEERRREAEAAAEKQREQDHMTADEHDLLVNVAPAAAADANTTAEEAAEQQEEAERRRIAEAAEEPIRGKHLPAKPAAPAAAATKTAAGTHHIALDITAWTSAALFASGGIIATVLSQCLPAVPSWVLLIGIAGLLVTLPATAVAATLSSKRQETLLFAPGACLGKSKSTHDPKQ